MEEEYDVELADIEMAQLTDWENEPTVRQLKKDCEDALSAHNAQVQKINGWLDLLEAKPNTRPKKENSRSNHQPKLIRKQAEWRYSSLSEPFLSTDKLFNTAPATAQDKLAAEQAGLVINHQFRNQINTVQLVDNLVRAAVNEGTLILRVGWETFKEEKEVEVPITEPGIVGYDEMQQPIVEDIVVGSEMQMQEVVTKNQPTIEVCDYNNVIVDPTCKGDLSKASFVIYAFETTLSDLKKAGKYKNLKRIRIDDNATLSDGNYESSNDSHFVFEDKPRKKLLAYEYWGYWDIDGSGMVKPFVATYVGSTMIRMEENPFPDQKIPFVSAPYLPVKNSIYGEPDGELLKENQQIIGAVSRGMIDILARNAAGQKGVAKGALDLPNKRKYLAGMDFEFNPTKPPEQIFRTQNFDTIAPSAEYMLSVQNADAESLTGVKAFHSGISGNALGATATGIRSALDATSKREIGILRRLAKAVEEAGKKIMAMNTEFLSEEEIVRITDDNFVTVNRDNLAGNYDIKITIATAEADNEKAQNMSFMLQTLGNNVPFDFTKMILSDIAKLHKMPELAKKLQDYQQPPNPEAQREAELRIALLEAQVINEQNKGRENAVDAQYKMAKTATEQAKARGIHSDSDLKDQDFLEKDQGLPQARELEKASHQAALKLDEKAAEKMLNQKDPKQQTKG